MALEAANRTTLIRDLRRRAGHVSQIDDDVASRL
jgi:hypothetical protein